MSVDDDRIKPGRGPLQHERRKNPPASRRLVIILFCLACLYVTGVLFIAQNANTKIDGSTYTNALAACNQRRALQVENNRRAPVHELDARNLAKLAKALTQTRRFEASAFAAIGRAFHIQHQVAPLIHRYRVAATLDGEIEASQETVRFDRLPLANCKKEVPKP